LDADSHTLRITVPVPWIPVEVRQPPPSAMENLAALISPLLQPLTTTGITIYFRRLHLLQRDVRTSGIG
jgi:hypothetical protein